QCCHFSGSETVGRLQGVMGNQVPFERCGTYCQACQPAADGSLPCSSGYVGSEEFVETREVKQMHAWTSPAGTPRGGERPATGFARMGTTNLVQTPSQAAIGTPQQVGVLEGLLGRLTGLEEKTVQYSDGSTYTGCLRNGLRHGPGVFRNQTEIYEGEWQDDVQHGSGKQMWNDGRLYEGQYAKGHFSGKGKMVWKTPKGDMCYEGEYLEDLKHGMGKFTWPDGRCYDGEWLRGKRHGRGAYTTARGDYRIGCWSEDRFVRWENNGCEQDSVNRMLR
ncbi:Phosphatidylinositol 4-phosphate 5-kinase 9 (AtPIP5K9) (1-phosphatidylinositol 4-phosphate kinase 9) (Diphosphoinositide kinase 9) (PtdIns(4)P-5-kinase 9), partial [Durusdinium trenchii]